MFDNIVKISKQECAFANWGTLPRSSQKSVLVHFAKK
jgi:hypothetical protein